MENMQVIEYWRKKYLIEAVVVLVISMLIIGLFFLYVSHDFMVLLCFLTAVCDYLMIKELRADLQTRGENLFLGRKTVDFEGLEFDFGRGIDEKQLLELEMIPAYQVRECGNVMKGNRFIMEEDWLYSVLSAKFLSFNQTSFQGVILRIEVPHSDTHGRGEIVQNESEIVISGELSSALKKSGYEKVWTELMDMFHADRIRVETAHGKMYFLIATKGHLFYQLSLLKPCQPQKFVERVQHCRQAAEQTASFLND